MSVPWKAISTRARLGNWSAMTWAAVALVLLCTLGTVIIGIQLFEITGNPTQFNTQ